MIHVRHRLHLAIGGVALLGGFVVGGAQSWAQAGMASATGNVPAASQPVAQSVPGGESMKLNGALNRLAKDPHNVEALLDAGKASLDLGDVDAAVGFFQRASELSPGNARAKAGLAGAHVLREEPFTAIPLFDEVDRTGPMDPARLADRGLAYDLIGDNATAQKYYRQSLEAAPSDETTRRLAVSQAIAGDRRAMEATLSPLLQWQDKAALRARAFALAILGQGDEAARIARQILSPENAAAFSAYLRYMPQLTPAQQASAANLGRFPRAAEIGRDDPRIAQYAQAHMRQAAVAIAPAASAQAPVKAKGKASLAAVAPPDPMVGKEVVDPSGQFSANGELPPVFRTPVATPTQPVHQSPVERSKQSPVIVPTSATTLLPAATPVPAPVQVAPALHPVSASASATKPVSLQEAFADFTAPSRAAEPKAGAVDVRHVSLSAPLPPREKFALKGAGKDAPKDATDKGKLTKDAKPVKGAKEAAELKVDPCLELAAPAKGKAKGKAGSTTAPVKGKAKSGKNAPTQCKDGKPSKAAPQPSRIWVQVAAGKDKKALAFDWRKFNKEDPQAFKGRAGYTSASGAANRLLTGPFDSQKDANAFIAKLRKAGRDGAFPWVSPAGQAVDPLR